MDVVRENLYDILSAVRPDPPVAVGGSTPALPLPALRVRGVDAIALPLSDVQAAALSVASAQASRDAAASGSTPLRDAEEPGSCAFDPSHFAVSPTWHASVNALAVRANLQLGGRHLFGIRPNRLVLCSAGGTFPDTRESDGAADVLGTFVVQFPSAFSGGAVAFGKGARRVTMDLARKSSEQFQYVAFGSGCTRNAAPIAAGHRLCIVYDLVQTPGATASSLTVQGNAPLVTQLENISQIWNSVLSHGVDVQVGQKLMVPLEHRCVAGSPLKADALRGRDAALVDVVRRAKHFGVGILVVERFREGVAVGSRKRRRHSAPAGTAHSTSTPFHDIEAKTQRIEVVGWACETGLMPPFNPHSLNITTDCDLVLDEGHTLFDGTPAREEVNSSGGGSVRQWYYTVVLVLWPNDHAFRLACATDVRASAAHVRELARAGDSSAAGLLTMLFDSVRDAESGHGVPHLLDAATALRDEAAARTALVLLAGRGGVASEVAVPAMLGALDAFGWESIETLSTKAIRATPAESLPHLLPMTEKLDDVADVVCAEPCDDDAPDDAPAPVRRVAHRLREQVAKQFAAAADVATAISEPRIVELGTGVDPGLEQRLLDAVGVLGPDELVALASKMKRPNGSVSGAVLRRFCQTVVPAAASMPNGVAAVRTVWHALLRTTPRDGVALAAMVTAAESNEVWIRGGGEALCAMAEAETRAQWGDVVAVRSAVFARVRRLESVQRPRRSTSFPRATVEQHAAVTAFLRGPKESKRFTGFRNIVEAREFAAKHFGALGERPYYSATAEARGRGTTSHVVIRKDSRLFEWETQRFERLRDELRTLRSWLSRSTAASEAVIVIDDSDDE